ncbi:MAG TPA: hypothetical protein VMH22_10225 [bacterium]|nr:hypothetical protein [bacterium]
MLLALLGRPDSVQPDTVERKLLLRFSPREFGVGLSSGRRLRCFRFPGRWMAGSELDRLREDVRAVALARLGTVPEYGVFLPGRAPWCNRVVTCLYDRDGRAIAFSTVMAYALPVDGRVHQVFQLGLVVSDGRSRQSTIGSVYFWPLAYILALRGFRQYWVASATMIPNIVGIFADAFVDVFPHYRRRRRPSPAVLAIARLLVSRHGAEFAAGPESRFDEETFAVSDGYIAAAAPLHKTWDQVAKHADPRCNELCRRVLDYQRGDDLLQIGRVNLGLLLRRTIGGVEKRR